MAIRHCYLRGETVITGLGTWEITRDGEALLPPDVDPKEVLLTLPDYMEDLGEGEVPVFQEDVPESLTSAEKLVKDLMTDPKNFNSAGALDLNKLNATLKAAGLSTVSGAERDLLMKRVGG